jgi:hypothetical protein
VVTAECVRKQIYASEALMTEYHTMVNTSVALAKKAHDDSLLLKTTTNGQ